ncbi:hypothetical protein [Methylobacterium aerolatum]|uniref:Uncharacterized protein n=1 Tax=Methylobacterium aerolatum TaxID=418708 RepID=A0ABU0HVG1_9HYPH|nr:hypothetical protein [Methylobacterium aerolatum]MDQ0445675.1 hypothetical protein [Methylobacterium aerolatum]GJD36215.1 hypothetical protein FMGBMHLM_3130 [Methylobacterium aerolatum]
MTLSRHDSRPAWLARLALVSTVLAGLGGAAQAQYYDGGPRYREVPAYEDEGYAPPPPRRRVVREAGYNCEAIQRGLTGPKPFSCPLPAPRPLGVRCFCDLPIASFSPAQTAVGHVVP